MPLKPRVRTALIAVLTANAAAFLKKQKEEEKIKPTGVDPATVRDAWGLTKAQIKIAYRLLIDPPNTTTGIAYALAVGGATSDPVNGPVPEGSLMLAMKAHIIESYSRIEAVAAASLSFPTLSVIRVDSAKESRLHDSPLPTNRCVILAHNIKRTILSVGGEVKYVVSNGDSLQLMGDKKVIAETVDALTDDQVKTIMTHQYFGAVIEKALD